MNPKLLEALTGITDVLRHLHVSIPIIVGTVGAIAAIIKNVTGDDRGLTLLDIANLVEAQVEANDALGRAEIARLKALLDVH